LNIKHTTVLSDACSELYNRTNASFGWRKKDTRTTSLDEVFRQLAARLSYCADTSPGVGRLRRPTKPTTRPFLISFVRCPLFTASYSDRRPSSVDRHTAGPGGTSMLLTVSSPLYEFFCPPDILLFSAHLLAHIKAASSASSATGKVCIWRNELKLRPQRADDQSASTRRDKAY